MKQKLRILDRYTRYLLTARTRHGVHSPFIFDLIDQSLRRDKSIVGAEDIERIRQQLLKDTSSINKLDFGAVRHKSQQEGVKESGHALADLTLTDNDKAVNAHDQNLRKNDQAPGVNDPTPGVNDPTPGVKYKARVCDIARTSLSRPSQLRLMYRLVKYFNPRNIIELGTSFGLSAAYLSLAAPDARIISMEGCPETAEMAQRTLNSLGIHNVKQVVGEFTEILPAEIEQLESVDFLFADGNHTMDATLEYFNLCKTGAVNDSVFVFDDIHWSDGMEQAWNIIKLDAEVRVTLDLFHAGLVFFRKESSPEHFTIRL